MKLTDYFNEDLVNEFLNVYEKRPYKHNKWGCKFLNSFFLYCYAKTIKPDLIVELGTYQGQTTWLLEQASNVTVYSFDITHKNLKRRTKKAKYIKKDWNEFWVNTRLEGNNMMIFIDDHTNQMQRLEEARARNFKHIFFDDNIPIKEIDSTAGSPIPTLQCFGEGKVLPTDTYLTYIRG